MHTEIFRTGWFLESLLTELVVLLVLRTYKPFFKSRPGTFLLWSTLAVAILACLMPHTAAGQWFGFVPLPYQLFAIIIAITLVYGMVSEMLKQLFHRKFARI